MVSSGNRISGEDDEIFERFRQIGMRDGIVCGLDVDAKKHTLGKRTEMKQMQGTL